jgi:glyoxylase-like metal-dependent hydrolase (beta-lactamase superfamily II)
LINTHWHFDHAAGNDWLHSVGAKIIAHQNTRKHLLEIQRVEDWDYNFLPSPPGAIPSEVVATLKRGEPYLDHRRRHGHQSQSTIRRLITLPSPNPA